MRNYLGIPDILEDNSEIYEKMVTKKKVERVNRKVDQILELIQKTRGDQEKKKVKEDLLRILIKKKKKGDITGGEDRDPDSLKLGDKRDS